MSGNTNRWVQVPTESITLKGKLSLPEDPKGVILIAPGSESSEYGSQSEFVALPKVKAPTLLIAGGDDLAVIALSRQALLHFRTERKLEVGLLTGAAVVMLPGLGSVLAAGTVGTLLGGTVAGAGIAGTFGGFAGALIGLGLGCRRKKHIFMLRG